MTWKAPRRFHRPLDGHLKIFAPAYQAFLRNRLVGLCLKFTHGISLKKPGGTFPESTGLAGALVVSPALLAEEECRPQIALWA